MRTPAAAGAVAEATKRKLAAAIGLQTNPPAKHPRRGTTEGNRVGKEAIQLRSILHGAEERDENPRRRRRSRRSNQAQASSRNRFADQSASQAPTPRNNRRESCRQRGHPTSLNPTRCGGAG